MPELLPRFYRRQQELEDAQRIATILHETGELPQGSAGGSSARSRQR